MCCYVFSMRECLFPNEVQSKYMNSWAKTTSRYIAHRRFVLVVKWWCYCNIISFTNECMWKGAAWRFAKKLHVQTLTRSGRPHVCSHTRSLQIQTTPTTTTGKKTAKYVCAWESRWHIYCVHVVQCIIVGYRQPVVVVQPATVVWWKIPQYPAGLHAPVNAYGLSEAPAPYTNIWTAEHMKRNGNIICPWICVSPLVATTHKSYICHHGMQCALHPFFRILRQRLAGPYW